MPETAMHEDSGMILGQHDIGASGEITAMDAESKAGPVQRLTDKDFRLGVSPAHFTHDIAALNSVVYIRHPSLPQSAQYNHFTDHRSTCPYAIHIEAELEALPHILSG